MAIPSPTDDLRRLVKYAAIVAAVLAWVCPLLPEPYRAPCHALEQICSLGAGGR